MSDFAGSAGFCGADTKCMKIAEDKDDCDFERETFNGYQTDQISPRNCVRLGLGTFGAFRYDHKRVYNEKW